MRAEKSIKNVMVTWISLLFISVGGFLVRVVMTRTMTTEYVGISGVFGNVLSVLSLAELGVGPAITFSLYKPIVENDEHQIIALMRLYKKFYYGVGMFVLVVGCALTPFLPFLVKEMPTTVTHIYFIYVMYVINASVSYFYSYKVVYITANQNYYIYSSNHALCYSIMYIGQALALIITKNYILYFGLQIIATVVENLRISNKADTLYPILKSREKYSIPEDTKKTIRTNVFAAIGHNLGDVVLNSTDTLIISKAVGVIEAAKYSCYYMIIATVNQFLKQAFSSIISIIGNLVVEGSEEQKKETFDLVFYVNFWLYAFSSTAIMVLGTPFVILCFGAEYELKYLVVIIIAVNFYSSGMRQTCITFKAAYGILIQDVHKAYIEAIVNLIVSIILVQKLGILGVLIGTLVSNYAVAFWIEPVVLYKYGLKSNPFRYFYKFTLYLISFGIIAFTTFCVVNLIPFEGILRFVLQVIVTAVLPNIMIIAFTFWTKPFKSFCNIVLTVVNNKLSR